MDFGQAFKLMKQGSKMKLPTWKGYWAWEDGTIMMHTKNGEVINLLDTENPEYTFSNMASDEFVIADETNTPILGGKVTMSFSDALKLAKRGLGVRLPQWEEGRELRVKYPYDSMFQKRSERIVDPFLYLKTEMGITPYIPNQEEIFSEDWEVVE